MFNLIDYIEDKKNIRLLLLLLFSCAPSIEGERVHIVSLVLKCRHDIVSNSFVFEIVYLIHTPHTRHTNTKYENKKVFGLSIYTPMGSERTLKKKYDILAIINGFHMY